MKKILFLFSITLFFSGIANARYSHVCADRKSKRNKAAAKTTMAHPDEGNYDITHLRFDLNITDTSIYIFPSSVTTTARVVVASMTDYVFELGPSLIIDSAKVNGALLPVSATGAVRRITLPSALAMGATFTAQVWYHGMPPTGGGFFNGITHTVSSGGTDMVYTVSDPWVALNWWPCKQSVNDQADSVNMYITVPSGVMAGSNGLLLHTDTTTTTGYWTHHWRTRYPIDYYLISIAIARYTDYKTYMHFTGSPDSMLIHNFFMDTATFNPVHKIKFDSVDHMINYFSSLFGRYPFWQEKYGMCFTTLGGGMEHQTMTTIGVTDVGTIAHELMHQWFGDHVTYKTWGDMWLSEGFATFSEHLYLGQFWGAAAAKTRRQAHLSSALSKACGMTYVNDTSTSDSLFTSNQYQKASIFINTLRYMAPADSLFFKILRNYQSTYSMGNASTADFKAIAESVYGLSLDTFFNQWVYGRGFPIYKTTWNQIGSTVYVRLVQTQSCPSYTSHFSTPVQLQLRAGSIDTFVKVYSSLDTQEFTFEWAPTMTSLLINPDVWTLLRNNGITKDAALGFGTLYKNNIRIHPNPAENNWHIVQLPTNTQLALTDMAGKVLWQGKSTSGTTLIPGTQLPPGNYMLKLSGTTHEHVKLVHW